MKHTIVFTFKSGKVSIITTSDNTAVDNLLALIDSKKKQDSFFKIKSVKGETFYIDLNEVSQIVYKKEE